MTAAEASTLAVNNLFALNAEIQRRAALTAAATPAPAPASAPAKAGAAAAAVAPRQQLVRQQQRVPLGNLQHSQPPLGSDLPPPPAAKKSKPTVRDVKVKPDPHHSKPNPPQKRAPAAMDVIEIIDSSDDEAT